jgi:hypothetical protein
MPPPLPGKKGPPLPGAKKGGPPSLPGKKPGPPSPSKDDKPKPKPPLPAAGAKKPPLPATGAAKKGPPPLDKPPLSGEDEAVKKAEEEAAAAAKRAEQAAAAAAAAKQAEEEAAAADAAKHAEGRHLLMIQKKKAEEEAAAAAKKPEEEAHSLKSQEETKALQQMLREQQGLVQQQHDALQSQQKQIEALREQVELLQDSSGATAAAVARSEAKRAEERREDAKRAEEALAAVKAEQEIAAKRALEDAERAHAVARDLTNQVANNGSSAMSTAMDRLEAEKDEGATHPLMVELPVDALSDDPNEQSKQELRASLVKSLDISADDVESVEFNRVGDKWNASMLFGHSAQAKAARIEAASRNLSSEERELTLGSRHTPMKFKVVPGALEETIKTMEEVREEQTCETEKVLCVKSVEVVSGGTGYTAAPTVEFSKGARIEGGSDAEAVAIVEDGAVVSIEVKIAIDGYWLPTNPMWWQATESGAPTVKLIGGGGSGAEANVVTEECDPNLFQTIKQGLESRPEKFAKDFIVPYPMIDNVARFTPDEMKGAIAALEAKFAGGDDAICYHFTSIWSLGLIFKGHGLRASCAGQLDGGLSVTPSSPVDLNWEQWAGNGFRTDVGKALWGSKYKDLLVADGAHEAGKDADKIDFLIVLRLKKAVLEDPSRVVPGRDKAYIISRTNLQQQDDGWHYLTLDHIVRVYCLVDPKAASSALDEVAEQNRAEVAATTEKLGWVKRLQTTLKRSASNVRPYLAEKEIALVEATSKAQSATNKAAVEQSAISRDSRSPEIPDSALIDELLDRDALSDGDRLIDHAVAETVVAETVVAAAREAAAIAEHSAEMAVEAVHEVRKMLEDERANVLSVRYKPGKPPSSPSTGAVKDRSPVQRENRVASRLAKMNEERLVSLLSSPAPRRIVEQDGAAASTSPTTASTPMVALEGKTVTDDVHRNSLFETNTTGGLSPPPLPYTTVSTPTPMEALFSSPPSVSTVTAGAPPVAHRVSFMRSQTYRAGGAVSPYDRARSIRSPYSSYSLRPALGGTTVRASRTASAPAAGDPDARLQQLLRSTSASLSPRGLL